MLSSRSTAATASLPETWSLSLERTGLSWTMALELFGGVMAISFDGRGVTANRITAGIVRPRRAVSRAAVVAEPARDAALQGGHRGRTGLRAEYPRRPRRPRSPPP